MAPSRDDIGTLESLALGVAELLSPLEEDLRDGQVVAFLAGLGLQLPPSVEGVGALGSGIQGIVTAAKKLPGSIESLIDALDADDYGQAVSSGAELIQAAVTIVNGIGETASAIRALSGPTGIPTATLNEFADNLPKRLLDYLVVRNLDGVPFVPEILEFLGVIERSIRNSGSTDPALPQFTEYKFEPEQAVAFIESPLERLKALYGWGEPTFDGSTLLRRIQALLNKAGVPTVLDDSVNPVVLDGMFFEAQARTDLSPRGLDLRFTKTVNLDNAIPFNQGGDWQLEGLSSGNLAAQALLTIQSDGTLTFEPPQAMATGEYGLRFTAAKADGTPWLIFGDPEATRLEVQKFILKLSAGFNFDTGTRAVDNNVTFAGEIQGGKLKIDFSGGDGFLSQILAGINLDSNFDLGFGVSSKEGLFFTGSAGLEIQLPAHIDLGPVRIDALTLSAGIDGADFPIAISANIGAQLGPLAAVIERMGVEAKFSLPAGRGGGNLGPAQFSLGFKPPNGVGLSLDAGPVKGGGYLYFDFDREEYAGALELVFSEWIALRAIGLITTRMPDGSKGFSMLIIITVEFGSGLQLGFGFTLIGVGGLVGIHRVALIEPLTAGVRTGAIESVMFPQDIIANAPRIISDLRAFFPPKQDIYLLGPMAKIGWGTPTLVTVSLGIIIEIPTVNITILGVIKLVLPDEDADILRLQVNFIGRLEPSNKLLWFYAELFDSRVLFMTLEGGMGLLVNWGDQANFVVSVGGFHPRYTPPPLPFPVPPRLAINILNEEYARIRVEAYFAVTSNSVQFGAKAELFFGTSEFNIRGHLAFDALFQFDPFFFSFGLSISLSVTVFGIGAFGVGFSGTLEGPTPWHIEGRGSITLLFIEISVPFSHTWGEDQDTALEPIEVLPLLEAEVNALTNWKAQLPPANSIAVTLRKLGGSEGDQDKLVLHPVGSLQLSQRKVPLNLAIDKVGNQRPSDANEFDIEIEISGGEALTTAPLREQFAKGQYFDLSESDRLSQPGFSTFESGVEVRVAGAQQKTSQAVKRVVAYETVVIDNHFKRFLRVSYVFFAAFGLRFQNFLFVHFLSGSAVKKSVLSKASKRRLEPFAERVVALEPKWSVVSSEDNALVDEAATFQSEQEARQYLSLRLVAEPGQKLDVIPDTEVNRAA